MGGRQGGTMVGRSAAQVNDFEEVEDVHIEERVGRLEVAVVNIQKDIADMKGDIREIRGDVKMLRAELHAQKDELRAESHAQGLALRGEIADLRLAFESFKGQVWVALAVLVAMHTLSLSGVPTLIARAFKWP